MRTRPYLLEEDASGDSLHPISVTEAEYDEAWLQEVLRAHPGILPVSEIEPVFHPMVPIGREVFVETGSETGAIDNLFISRQGYLTLVETKLWRNPEARRKVVGQVLEYASALTKWNYDRLNVVARAYTKQYQEAEQNLSDWVGEKLDFPEGGQGFFEDTVSKNLRLGCLLVLVVGDEIRQSVVDTVEYVNKYPGLALGVALVELRGYWLKTGAWPILLVPRVVAKTEIVERSIVQVTVMQDQQPQVEVSQEMVGEDGAPLTEEAFWERLQSEVSAQEYSSVRGLIAERDIIRSCGLTEKRRRRILGV